MQMNYSLNVANSVGGSNRAPILIPTEYNGWASRMRNYLKTKGKGIWRSVEEGPYLPTFIPRPNTAEEALGGTSQPRLTPLDIEKMDNDQIPFTEIQCGIPPELFDLIQNCTTAQQIWVLLQNIFLGTEEAKDQKLVSSVSDYTHFSTFAGESLSQAFTRFSIIVTRLLSSGAERTNQEINLRFLEGLGKDWVLVKTILQDSGKLKTFNMYRLYNNLIGQERDIKGNRKLQLGGPLALIAEHNHQTQNIPQQQVSPNINNPQFILAQSVESHQTNSIPSYHPSQPQISYPSNYQTPTNQLKSSSTSQPSIQSKSRTLALPAPVQASDSHYSEYDESEEAAYQHEIALISQKFNRISSYSNTKKNYRPTNQNGGSQSRNYQRGHKIHHSYQKPEVQHQDKTKSDPVISSNTIPTAETKESEVIKCHNCGGPWHYAADCRAPRNYPKAREEEKVKAFVASGNVEIWSSGDDDEQFENKRKRGQGFGECMMVQAKQETPIPGVTNSKTVAESSSSYTPKNYAFMVNHKTGKGVSIIEQAFSTEEQDDKWLIDSACSMHMTGRLEFLRDYREVNFGGYVTFGNDANGIIKGYGVLTNGNFTIQKVAYVLGLKHNLISVGQLVSTSLRVEFDNEFSYIMTGTRDKCLIRSSRQINMFPLDITMCPGKPRLCLLTKAHSEISWLWHQKLAHLNFRYMNQLVTEEMVRGLPLLRFDNENLCAACAFGKQKKKPDKTISDSSITRPLELLHMDLCGPSTVASINHKKYILVIVDDYSLFTWVFFLRLKSDTFSELKNFITSIELKIQLPVRRIRSDNGTEFNNKQIEEFLTSKGIEHNFSAPYTPQQNGVVERRNRTLVEAAR
ncbi:hypothetical protein L1887_28124 [Cichorium endivia]|nr:hypothetical protein L1887_28124 [Cichorium endivia]